MNTQTHTDQLTDQVTDQVNCKCWVVSYGLDCDGHNSGHIYRFSNEEEAYIFSKELNDSSDGLVYAVIKSKIELKEYCESYGKNWKNYDKN